MPECHWGAVISQLGRRLRQRNRLAILRRDQSNPLFSLIYPTIQDRKSPNEEKLASDLRCTKHMKNTITEHTFSDSRIDTALAQEVSTLERMARWYTGDPMEAEDLVQDTCVLALRFGDSFRDGSNLRAWLLRMMRNRHISILRRKQLERRVFETEGRHTLIDWSIGETSRRSNGSGGGIQIDEGFSDPVSQAMDGLRPEFREVIWLCDVEGLSYAEAARKTSRPVGTIMSRLHRGRRALRRKLGSRRELEAA